MDKKLTIIICTYNRSELLKYCLESLVEQTASKDLYDVLIVNNNSTDDTDEVVQRYINDHINFKLVVEKKQGLSNARNRGIIESETEWIGFLDDDGKAWVNFIERALFVIENYSFDCFGGTYYAWWKYGKPKWLREDFGTKKLLLPEIGELNSKDTNDIKYLSGGIMFVRRKIFQKIGFYNQNLGMNEKSIAFGEEIELQNRIKECGYKIGYDPGLAMDHLVNDYKLKVNWHLECCYAKARDDYQMKKINTEPWLFLIIRLLKNICFLPFEFIFRLLKVCFIQKYYISSAWYDSLKNIYTYAGKIKAKILGN